MDKKSIILGDVFEVSKTPDAFFDVIFEYEDGYTWDGALPVKLRYQGFEISEEISSLSKFADENYGLLSKESADEWDKVYLYPAVENELYGKDTTKVLYALKSGKWECRVCGPVPSVNAQSASRLRVLKQKGFCIATKNKYCENCKRSTHHDLLVKIPLFDDSNVVKRYPIPAQLKKRIYTLFNHHEACFERIESPKNLIIDHKFPSDRWKEGEAPNSNDMTDKEIRSKFQLLTNQTNMIKSRECSKCVRTGKRGIFMGIKWYYEGDENWNGQSTYDEQGCIGCPWYDLIEWKSQAQNKLNN